MPILTRRALGAVLVAAGTAFALPAQASDTFITVASTTSTEQSGLFDHLLPIFTQQTGITVRVVAQGTGQALETGRRGDADVVLVHDTKAEAMFVEQGFALKRQDVMYNDFILIGPKSDPAKATGKDIAAALKRVAEAKAAFTSRGDDSGTHRAELRFWKEAGLDPKTAGDWYKETGSGMGPTLNTASAMDAYVLADRGTWLNFKNRGDLGLLVEGDKRLFNQYGVMLVSAAKHPHVKAAMGQRFIDWLVSEQGQTAIAAYTIGGESVFFPNATPAS